MKIQLSKLVDAKDGLEWLIEQPLQAAVSYKITELVEEINKKMLKIEEQISVLKEEASQGKKQYADLRKEVDELLKVETTIDYEPISFSKLHDLKIQPKMLLNLKYFFDFEDQNEKTTT